MLRHNMGRLDRTVRLIGGAALVPIGLVALGGWHGSLAGILVAAFAVLPLMTGLMVRCARPLPSVA